MRITLFYLWRKNACKAQRKLFKKTFGWSAEINMENFRKARAAGLDTRFFRKYLASGKIRLQLNNVAQDYYNGVGDHG